VTTPCLVLIVDDTPTNLDAISETLSDAGYDIAISTSGERALQTVQRRLPDLILLDVMMPGLDGFATCKRLKADSQTCDIPVIFMTALADADSKIKGFDCGGVDYITKPFNEREVLLRVKTHLQLRQLTQNLEREVADKTADLQAAKEAAEAANRAKTAFLATIGHELRTPLNSILGMTEGLQAQMFGAIPERQLHPLQTIERNSKQLLESIEDLLDLAKIGTGKIELSLQPISVRRLCELSFDAVRLSATKKKIQFAASIPPDLPDLMVDKRRMGQVLIELFSNTIKFTPVGGQVRLEISMVAKGTLQIAVIDNGIGIAAENIPNLFQNFNQIDNALDRSYEGMGIGLALVKHIVENHGGCVSVTSGLGTGSCFTIKLPVTTLTSNLITNTPATQDLDFSTANPIAILLIETDLANIATMTAYLKSRGYDMLIANDREQAIEIVRLHLPNLILISERTTMKGGTELLQQLRQLPESATTPIIIFIDSSKPETKQRCLDAGASTCLFQPVNFSQLMGEIKALVKPR
jgi:signal transduction histidine kinase